MLKRCKKIDEISLKDFSFSNSDLSLLINSALPITLEIEIFDISGFAGIRMSLMNLTKYSNTKKLFSGISFNIFDARACANKYKYN